MADTNKKTPVTENAGTGKGVKTSKTPEGAGTSTTGTGNPEANKDLKTTTSKAEPKVSDSLEKIGKGLLKNNPAMSVVFMTSDGLGFYEKNDADNHAFRLKNKGVTPVKR